MTCASCGKRNPAGARYCIHCGAEQSVPTPIAAVAAAATAMAHATRTQAANAAQAEPGIAGRMLAANQASAMPLSREPVPAEGTRGAPPRPAYDAVPRRGAVAVALLVGCVLAGLATLAGWRMQSGNVGLGAVATNAGADRVTSGSTRSEAAPRDARVAAAESAVILPAPRTTSEEAREAANTAGASAPADATLHGGVVPAAGEPPPIEIKSLPARPAPARTPRRAPTEKVDAPTASAVPAPASEPPPAPPTRVAVAAPPAAAVRDRWSRMHDDLSRCTREDFIARVICSQRVRFNYCDGYWGRVDQCPANPPTERGQ